MTKSKATIIAFLVTPLFTAILLTDPSKIPNGISFGWLLLAGLFVYVWTGAAILLFAYPLLLILNYFELVKWWSCLLSGFLLGGLVAVILVLPNHPHIDLIARFSLVGALSAFCFWLIWRQGKSDF